MMNGQLTNNINIQRGVRRGCPFSMILFILSTIPLYIINMIKEEKHITGHITKHLCPVKVQSYADDTTKIINLPHELEYVKEIYENLLLVQKQQSMKKKLKSALWGVML